MSILADLTEEECWSGANQHTALPLADRLRRRTVVDEMTGCWIWTGARKGKGYGHLKLNGRNISAHRASYELFVGPIPDGLTIDHLCGVKLCVNPAHLEPCSRGENVRRHYRKVGDT